MRVLSIGGGGGMGRTTARTALGFPFVEEIVLAGIDHDRATRFARSLSDPRIRSIHLDITDEDALRQAIRQCDVVLNSAGPFFRFGLPVLRATIAEGKHYCDICDDWEPTLDMLGLDEEARRRGVTAIIGLGASPGIANLLAVKATEQLDEVRDLYSAWRLSNAHNEDDGFFDEAEANTDAAAVHLVHCLSEKIPLLRNGSVTDRLPLEHCGFDYPGVGKLDIWTIGHPEAVTLPRHYPNLSNCLNGMLGVESIIADLQQLADQVRAGSMNLEQAAGLLTSDGGREKRRQQLQAHEAADAPGILAFAAGMKNGRPARAGARLKHVPRGGMSAVTGIPHALFLPLLHQGSIKGPGVFSPEQAVDADAFFALLNGFVDGHDCGLDVTFAH